MCASTANRATVHNLTLRARRLNVYDLRLDPCAVLQMSRHPLDRRMSDVTIAAQRTDIVAIQLGLLSLSLCCDQLCDITRETNNTILIHIISSLSLRGTLIISQHLRGLRISSKLEHS